MEPYSAETRSSQQKRRKPMQQVADEAIRQAEELSGEDQFSAWEAGQAIGTALSAVAMRRLAGGSKSFDMAGLLMYVLDMPTFNESPDQHARLAIFISMCCTLEHAVKHAYESGELRFKFDSETDVMSGAVNRAAERVRRYRQYRASVVAA